MRIALTRSEIEKTISKPRFAKGVERYLWLQSRIDQSPDFHLDKTFRRTFNTLYIVRRDSVWQSQFYAVMGRSKGASFAEVHDDLLATTHRPEMTMATKIVAIYDPKAPIIDPGVIEHLDLKLPPYGQIEIRRQQAADAHEAIKKLYADYLNTPDGKFLVDTFRKKYPNAATVETVKLIDMVVWQVRP